MAEKKKKNTEEVVDSKKLAALEARIEGLNEQLEEAGKKAQDAEKKVEEAGKKADDAKADYLRLMAEFDTFPRRTAEEKPGRLRDCSGCPGEEHRQRCRKGGHTHDLRQVVGLP